MTKYDVANTVRILLSLDQVYVKELMKLPEDVLNKMYAGYIQNAKNYNHQEDELRKLKTENLQLKRALQSQPTSS